MLPSFAPCRSSPGSLHAGEIASGMPLGCKRGAESGDLAPETDGVASPEPSSVLFVARHGADRFPVTGSRRTVHDCARGLGPICPIVIAMRRPARMAGLARVQNLVSPPLHTLVTSRRGRSMLTQCR